MKNKNQLNLVRISSQSGAVLFIGLILLLLLTLLGITAVNNTALEEKMAGGVRQQNIAFQAAESALRDAEQFILGTNAAFNPLKINTGGPFQGESCVAGLCPTTSPELWAAPDFDWATLGRAYSGTTPIPNVAQQPRYVIELLRTDPSTDSGRIYATFRITANAWGTDAKAVVRLQTIYKLHANSFVN